MKTREKRSTGLTTHRIFTNTSKEMASDELVDFLSFSFLLAKASFGGKKEFGGVNGRMSMIIVFAHTRRSKRCLQSSSVKNQGNGLLCQEQKGYITSPERMLLLLVYQSDKIKVGRKTIGLRTWIARNYRREEKST